MSKINQLFFAILITTQLFFSIKCIKTIKLKQEIVVTPNDFLFLCVIPNKTNKDSITTNQVNLSFSQSTHLFSCDLENALYAGTDNCCVAYYSGSVSEAGFWIETGTDGLLVEKISYRIFDNNKGYYRIYDINQFLDSVNASNIGKEGQTTCGGKKCYERFWVDSDGNKNCKKVLVKPEANGYGSLRCEINTS